MEFSDENIDIKSHSSLAERKRREAARKRRERERRMALIRLILRAVALVTAIVLVVVLINKCDRKESTNDDVSSDSTLDAELTVSDEPRVQLPTQDSGMVLLGADINSNFVAVLRLDTNKIIASKNLHERMYPASTTKIMTALVAYENAVSMDSTFTVTTELIDPLYRAEATLAGFADGEAVTVRDLIYGTILPSGAEAAEGVAIATAGSVEEFVKLMNQKVEALGIKNTHFSNVTGLHDTANYSTAYDMAIILKAAMKVPFLREVLSTYQYTTAPTAQHPEGVPLTGTLFSYMYGTEPEGADILGGKTGYVYESGYCIASFGRADSGTEYICVTTNAESKWPAVYDQINIYSTYVK